MRRPSRTSSCFPGKSAPSSARILTPQPPRTISGPINSWSARPGIRGLFGETLPQRGGPRLQIDQPVLDREGLPFGLVQTAHRQHLRARIDAEAGSVARRSGTLAKIDQPVGIALAALFDL